MEKIEVGEYVRTKKYICKVTKIMEQDEELPLYYCTDLDFGFLEKDIEKHSFDITDLIEKDDYINDCRVYEVEERGITVYQKVENSSTDYNWITKDEIENVVTKEAFESIKYEV